MRYKPVERKLKKYAACFGREDYRQLSSPTGIAALTQREISFLLGCTGRRGTKCQAENLQLRLGNAQENTEGGESGEAEATRPSPTSSRNERGSGLDLKKKKLENLAEPTPGKEGGAELDGGQGEILLSKKGTKGGTKGRR